MSKSPWLLKGWIQTDLTVFFEFYSLLFRQGKNDKTISSFILNHVKRWKLSFRVGYRDPNFMTFRYLPGKFRRKTYRCWQLWHYSGTNRRQSYWRWRLGHSENSCYWGDHIPECRPLWNEVPLLSTRLDRRPLSPVSLCWPRRASSAQLVVHWYDSRATMQNLVYTITNLALVRYSRYSVYPDAGTAPRPYTDVSLT